MVNKVFVDPDGLLQVLVIGPQSRESVREMGEKLGFYAEQLRHDGQPVLILDDLRKMGETTTEARSEVARIAKALDYDRCAMVGDGSWPMRYGTNLMLRAIGRCHVRYFGNLETARKWLQASYQKPVL